MAVAEAIRPQTETMTAAELCELSAQQPRYELNQGELVELPPLGAAHGNVALRLGAQLLNFVTDHQLGQVLVETGYRLAANPDTRRSPDVSFLAADKIPAAGLPEGFIEWPPTLAIEIVLPNDKAAQIQAKIQDYLQYGSQMVWAVYPQQKLVVVHHPDGAARTLQAANTLAGEPALPGFSCPVAEIFG